MRFWTREIAGWLLVGLGLFAFYMSAVLLFTQHVIEAGPMTVIAIIIFRGGIHLLKVAVAARVCLLANERLGEESASIALRPKPRAKINWDLPGKRSR